VIEDLRQTDLVTTPTHAGLRRRRGLARPRRTPRRARAADDVTLKRTVIYGRPSILNPSPSPNP